MWFVIPYWKVQSYVRCVTKPHKEWGWTCGAFKDNFSQNASAQWARALPEKRKKAHGPSQLSRLFHLLGNLMHHQLSQCHWLVQPIGRNRIIKEHELLILWQNTWIWLHFQAQNCQVDLSHLSFHKSFFFHQDTFNHSLASTHCCQKSESVHMSTSHICNGCYFDLRKKM